MVHMRRTWYCDRCRKPFLDPEEARSCELGHITQDAVDRTQARIRAVFDERFATPLAEGLGDA